MPYRVPITASIVPGCGNINWQVGGTIVGNVATLAATQPTSSYDSCGNPTSSSIAAAVTFPSCTAGAATETSIIPPWKNQFGQSGSGGTYNNTGAWALATAQLTFTISSPSQIAVPGLANGAQMIPLTTVDTPQVKVTPSSNFSSVVGYPTTFLGNTDSNCQASLSIPNGTTSSASSLSAGSSCGDGSGIFTVSGSIGQSTTQNALYVVVAPQVLVRELWGEANGKVAAGDNVSELAIGNAIRQRFIDNQYLRGFNNYQAMTVAPWVNQLNGLGRCQPGCLTGVGLHHGTETTNAALIYAGVNTSATQVADSKCFVSPTPGDWNKIQTALQMKTTLFPTPLDIAPTCWSAANRQLVYKTSIGNNASYPSSPTPACIFEQWRDSSSPAVIQIP